MSQEPDVVLRNGLRIIDAMQSRIVQTMIMTPSSLVMTVTLIVNLAFHRFCERWNCGASITTKLESIVAENPSPGTGGPICPGVGRSDHIRATRRRPASARTPSGLPAIHHEQKPMASMSALA
jgi:hypothetical protein